MIDKELSEQFKQMIQLLREIAIGVELLVQIAKSNQQSYTRVNGEIYDK